MSDRENLANFEKQYQFSKRNKDLIISTENLGTISVELSKFYFHGVFENFKITVFI